MKSYLAIDAGGTFLKSAVLSQQGDIFSESTFSVKSFSDCSIEMISQSFIEVVTNGLNFIHGKGMELGGIGIAFPGPFDIEKAVPLMHHKFNAIYGMNMRDFIWQACGVPNNIPVKFIHDANAVLAGELWKGNAVGYDNAAVVTLGTGLGFAISQNGKILCNEVGGPFLSIFKIPYKDGILEDYTAQRGFLKIYGELNGHKTTNKIRVADIGRWAEEGEVASIKTFQKVGEILSKALQNVIEERNIECLLFGGQISRSFHHIEPSLQSGLKNLRCLKQVSPVKNIDNAALLGVFSIISL